MFMNTNDNNYTSEFLSGGQYSVEQLLLILDNIPLCINLVNDKAQSVYCNKYTVDLYGVSSSREYNERFYDLTPIKQPDGKNSRDAFFELISKTLQDGEVAFNWVDRTQSGEELPLEITLKKLGFKDDNGDELILSLMRDLRSQIAGYENDDITDDVYFNKISYKAMFYSVAELVEEWFWVYDFEGGTIQFFGKNKSILDLPADKNPFPLGVVDSGIVYPEDTHTFMRFVVYMKRGERLPVVVRFISPDGTARYYRIIYNLTFDENGNPLFAIGKTYDIDKQKTFETLSQTDMLTNCYNKITTENLVRDILVRGSSNTHAMFIVDIDDFKSINDNLGHHFGDNVLRDIADKLRNNFREADIVGRIGGDEFLVFVKNINDMDKITTRANAISQAFSESYSGEYDNYKVSGSIGVAVFPKDATSYEELYKCADKALYQSKLKGKDCYTLYSREMARFTGKKLTVMDDYRAL